MKNWNQKIGKKGEDLAQKYLESQCVRIIARNQRTQYGEIDLIGIQNDAYLFIEVKTRTSTKYGVPELSITDTKLQHMMDCATDYIQSHDIQASIRIDVIAILLDGTTTKPEIEWIQNVTQ